MQTGTWLMMALILGIVWGGFGVLLWRSMRAEARKSRVTGGE